MSFWNTHWQITMVVSSLLWDVNNSIKRLIHRRHLGYGCRWMPWNWSTQTNSVMESSTDDSGNGQNCIFAFFFFWKIKLIFHSPINLALNSEISILRKHGVYLWVLWVIKSLHFLCTLHSLSEAIGEWLFFTLLFCFLAFPVSTSWSNLINLNIKKCTMCTSELFP